MHPNGKLMRKDSFTAVGAWKDIQYSKKYVSFLNMIKLKISETFIAINFDSNV